MAVPAQVVQKRSIYLFIYLFKYFIGMMHACISLNDLSLS